jgi:hypothetical protein
MSGGMAYEVAMLTFKMRRALLALDEELRSAASLPSTTPQAVQALAARRPHLVEREFQDGCAQRFYYRLSSAGLAVKAYLAEELAQ